MCSVLSSANLDKSIDALKSQKNTIADSIEDSLDRKLTFLKYENDRLDYKLDESLYYILQKIQEVDKGPDPVSYMYSLRMPNLVEPGPQAHTSMNLFESHKTRISPKTLLENTPDEDVS